MLLYQGQPINLTCVQVFNTNSKRGSNRGKQGFNYGWQGFIFE